jgi:hypothetical protein
MVPDSTLAGASQFQTRVSHSTTEPLATANGSLQGCGVPFRAIRNLTRISSL